MVFQDLALWPNLSVVQNVSIGLTKVAGLPRMVARERAAAELRKVFLADHMSKRPHELSGGQQQRVAIARALAGRPKLLIADEPTGQLDSQTGRQIMRLLRTVVHSEGITALVATHDPVLIELADQTYRLDDGVLTSQV